VTPGPIDNRDGTELAGWLLALLATVIPGRMRDA
jgi:hypothetical protein